MARPRKVIPEQYRPKYTSVAVSTELADDIREIARLEDRSQNRVIRRAIDLYLASDPTPTMAELKANVITARQQLNDEALK